MVETNNAVYLAQCVTACHVYEVVRGSALEARCIERQNEGFLDAIALPYEDCPNCLEDRRVQLRMDANSCRMAGCAQFKTYEECRKNNGGCIFGAELIALGESKYIDMLRGIPQNAQNNAQEQEYDVFENPELNQDMGRDWIEWEAAQQRERKERERIAAEEAKKIELAKCRRCQHPYNEHSVYSCRGVNKKGNQCGCPRLVH